jgi:2-polyprenyl-3-methyl-5-hydroxy-6-metoxy-1,4-benzoquinol methylase
MKFEEDYFKNYKEQSFRWIFWSKFITKHVRKNSKILDLGCSYGYLFKYLKGYKTTGTDISKHAIKVAKKLNPDSEFHVMNAEQLKLKQKFNLVLALDIFEHLEDPTKVLHNIYNQLETNGLLILTTPNSESLSKKINGKNWFAYKDKTHIAINKRKYWEKLLTKHEFKILKSTSIDVFDLPTPFFTALNLILYKLRIPFIPKFGDNTIIIAKKL